MACSGGQLHETSEDVDAWYRMYVYGAYGASADEEISRAYISFVNEIPAWFDEHGIAMTWLEAEGDGYKTPLKYLTGLVDSPDGFGGAELFDALDAAAMSRGVDVRVAPQARRLVQNPQTKEIVGVIAEDAEGNRLTFKAKRPSSPHAGVSKMTLGRSITLESRAYDSIPRARHTIPVTAFPWQLRLARHFGIWG